MDVPTLTQFRLEFQENGLVHLVFDCPDKSMNVFSNAAIHELGAFARWLPDADVTGVVIRSGKDSAFCAGADLSELGVAYDMIMAAPARDRFNVAFDHFFALSAALRAIEVSGKPVAAAVEGLALGGGCELALAAHYRVMVDDPKVVMGLPESLVGLLPGGGGTQRLPRLIGVKAALPILLDGARLSGQAALDTGLVDTLVVRGDAVAVAEAWLLSAPALRPQTAYAAPVDDVLRGRRASVDPHNPALTAILDCVEFGLPQCFDGAIRTEMSIFAHLIQRPEPRNMIQTLFLGKTDHDRASRKGELPAFVAEAVAAARGAGDDPEAICAAVAPWADRPFEERRMADYAIVSQTGFPYWLGGPFTLLKGDCHDQDDRGRGLNRAAEHPGGGSGGEPWSVAG
jgi:3-hydroxyacyl-CoA dehydrogenase / enoyl-CoA hydratase / 3-hydroxybutyryl-CoA epimerase